jgi:hypothetical protein
MFLFFFSLAYCTRERERESLFVRYRVEKQGSNTNIFWRSAERRECSARDDLLRI